ncbi:TPA: hypothetical protein ACGW3M_000953 [Pseudomonas aeruginosa]|uniref:hypothetical protein n=1 Tax=Pseudomonas aeruginosa TaxID=287 RepID=UPI0027FCE999|nr:hypothetical protein [Pseudomonas aeruginosa]EKY4113707.1 hypothetical protein [Pseudomonas aeruginosa]ELJ2276229.1 hypothetical protein [Pseudomonas aeruginosa]MBX6653693.1 hypothetical protein [Pseudomonas aeruginosa]
MSDLRVQTAHQMVVSLMIPQMFDEDGWPIDLKGDPAITRQLKFICRGQTAYGEWLKKLSKRDRPPRGSCARFFEANQDVRQ